MKAVEQHLAPFPCMSLPSGVASRQQGLGAPAVVVGPQLRALAFLNEMSVSRVPLIPRHDGCAPA